METCVGPSSPALCCAAEFQERQPGERSSDFTAATLMTGFFGAVDERVLKYLAGEDKGIESRPVIYPIYSPN
ncbi:hypothetical protein OYC64_001242 [Pagothenia borchgrevinki]|uniref:Uncharacterized protein n=1 Tax=Pagothenia borchgrevinki TaxID=8213 RepID=A0ABD2GAU1_PAGBO